MDNNNKHRDVKPDEQPKDQEPDTREKVTDASGTPIHYDLNQTSTTGSNQFEEDAFEQITVTSDIENKERNEEEENKLKQQHPPQEQHHTQKESNNNAGESGTGQALTAPSQLPFLRGRIFESYIRILQNNLKFSIKLIKENEDEDLRAKLEGLLEQLNNEKNSMTYRDFVNIRATIRSYCESVNIYFSYTFWLLSYFLIRFVNSKLNLFPIKSDSVFTKILRIFFKDVLGNF